MLKFRKAKFKKPEPETEFVAPHSLEACMERLQALENAPIYDDWHQTETLVQIQAVDSERWQFIATRAFKPRVGESHLKAKPLKAEVAGMFTPLSDQQRTMVLMQSKAKESIFGWAKAFLVHPWIWALIGIGIIVLILEPTRPLFLLIAAYLATFIGKDLYQRREDMAGETRRLELRSEIRRVLLL